MKKLIQKVLGLSVLVAALLSTVVGAAYAASADAPAAVTSTVEGTDW